MRGWRAATRGSCGQNSCSFSRDARRFVVPSAARREARHAARISFQAVVENPRRHEDEELGLRVVAVREEVKTQTASGLYLPDSSKEKPVLADVVAVGPTVKDLKVGDKIIYKEYSTTELKVHGKDYLIMKEEDVLATV